MEPEFFRPSQLNTDDNHKTDTAIISELFPHFPHKHHLEHHQPRHQAHPIGPAPRPTKVHHSQHQQHSQQHQQQNYHNSLTLSDNIGTKTDQVPFTLLQNHADPAIRHQDLKLLNPRPFPPQSFYDQGSISLYPTQPNYHHNKPYLHQPPEGKIVTHNQI